MSDTKYSLKKQSVCVHAHVRKISCKLVTSHLLGVDNLFDLYLSTDFFFLLDRLVFTKAFYFFQFYREIFDMHHCVSLRCIE